MPQLNLRTAGLLSDVGEGPEHKAGSATGRKRTLFVLNLAFSATDRFVELNPRW